ncbi:26996_t:CDS:2, partial [Gigaspora margarita]
VNVTDLKYQVSYFVSEINRLKEEINQQAQRELLFHHLNKELRNTNAAFFVLNEQLNKKLIDKDALIKKFADQFKKQNDEIIRLGQICKYLDAKLNKTNLTLPSELEKQTYLNTELNKRNLTLPIKLEKHTLAK